MARALAIGVGAAAVRRRLGGPDQGSRARRRASRSSCSPSRSRRSAAASGRGSSTALLSSVALPWIEQPANGFQFEQLRDVIASVVFLAIAAVVGLVVGQRRGRAAPGHRARARGPVARAPVEQAAVRRRPRSGARRVRRAVARTRSGWRSCTRPGGARRAGDERDRRGARASSSAGRPRSCRSLMASVPLGTLTTERPARARSFTRRERELLEAATRQAAVALDRARLDARARLAQLDAETNQLRAAMFSSVTHDLRTPLASIKAGVTSLLDEPRPCTMRAQQRELLHDDPGGDRPVEPAGRATSWISRGSGRARSSRGGCRPRSTRSPRRSWRGCAPALERGARLELAIARRPPRDRRRPDAARPGADQPRGERRATFRRAGRRSRSRRPGGTRRARPRQRRGPRASLRSNGRRSSKPSIVAARSRSVRAVASGWRSLARS